MPDPWTSGVEAADFLLGHVHDEIAKALDPLDPDDFLVIVARLEADLARTASPIETAAMRAALQRLDVDWPALSVAQRNAAFEAARQALQRSTERLLPAVGGRLRGRNGLIFGPTRAALARNLPPKYRLEPSLSLRDREAERLVRRGNYNFIRDELGRRVDDLSELAREVVARGLEEGLGRDAIASNLGAAMGGRVVRSESYWNVVAGAYANRARSYSSLLAFEDAGVQTYTFEAILDEVTCFAAGTRVLLADGTQMAIELTRVGDLVLSCRGNARRVVALRVYSKRTWGTIRLEDGRSLRVTPNHPLLTTKGWKRAGQIEEGERVVEYGPELGSLWEDVPLRDAVPRNVAAQELLLGGVQSSGALLPSLRGQVPCAGDLHRAGAGEVLLGSVQGGGAQEGGSRVRAGAELRDLRGGVPGQSWGGPRREGKAPLLEALPEAPHDPGLRALRDPVREEGLAARDGEVLLGCVLPAQRRGDKPRSDDAEDSRGGGDPLRPGGEDRPLVDRLPGGGPLRAGGRWGVLALERVDPEKGCGEGRGASRTRVRGEPPRGEGDPGVPAGRSLLASRLWPFPVDDLESRARSVRVASVRWELTTPAPAYDIEVEEDAGYIAEGVVVHNTDICRFMHGTSIRVEAARAAMDRALALENPEDIRDVAPWVRTARLPDGRRELYVQRTDGSRYSVAEVTRSGVGRRDDTGSYRDQLTPAELEARGLAVPPLHGKCRSSILAE